MWKTHEYRDEDKFKMRNQTGRYGGKLEEVFKKDEIRNEGEKQKKEEENGRDKKITRC